MVLADGGPFMTVSRAREHSRCRQHGGQPRVGVQSVTCQCSVSHVFSVQSATCSVFSQPRVMTSVLKGDYYCSHKQTTPPTVSLPSFVRVSLHHEELLTRGSQLFPLWRLSTHETSPGSPSSSCKSSKTETSTE